MCSYVVQHIFPIHPLPLYVRFSCGFLTPLQLGHMQAMLGLRLAKTKTKKHKNYTVTP